MRVLFAAIVIVTTLASVVSATSDDEAAVVKRLLGAGTNASSSASVACSLLSKNTCVALQTPPGVCRWCPTAWNQGACYPISYQCDCTKIQSGNDCMDRAIFGNCEWCPYTASYGDFGGTCIVGGSLPRCPCHQMSRATCETSEQCKPCPTGLGLDDFQCVPSTTQCNCSRIPNLNACIAPGTRSGGACAWCPSAASPMGGWCGDASRLCSCSAMGPASCGAYPYCRYCAALVGGGGQCQPLSRQCAN